LGDDVFHAPHKIGADFPAIVVSDKAQQPRCSTLRIIMPA
jgi:hypothetical protein